jgi:hypothetical protein
MTKSYLQITSLAGDELIALEDKPTISFSEDSMTIRANGMVASVWEIEQPNDKIVLEIVNR